MADTSRETGGLRVKRGLAEMLKGGVIMDVTTAEQAKIAEDAGAVAVMALERVPADIRAEGGVVRMADTSKVHEIMESVSVPVMAKCRIGHFVEAQVLESIGVDYIDESEVLTPADESNHVDKWDFTVPFVCGATNLGEALRRIGEGAAMIRSKGEAGTGNVVEAVRHMRAIGGEMKRLTTLDSGELMSAAKELQAPFELVREIAQSGKLPVVLFTAGGIATPADAALMMQLGAEGVFVGSGIFKSGDPELRARAIVDATTHFADPDIVAKVSQGLGEPMVGINVSDLPDSERLAAAAGSGLKIGVLALQGDVREHLRALESAGATPVEVRTAAHLEEVEALVVPGGESTTIGKLLDRFELLEPLKERANGGMPLFGTCAGLILMANEIVGGQDAPAPSRCDGRRGEAQRLRTPGRLVRIGARG